MVAEDDKGLFGWKEWKLPKHPVRELETKPHPTKDGHYDADDYFCVQKPDRYALPTDQFNPVRYPNLSPAWTLWRDYGIMPKFKTYFTSIGGQLKNNAGGKCQKFELEAMECLEYYGLQQGMDACKDWYDDLMECRFHTKQDLRATHMYSKRNFDNRLEYYQGKRDHIYEPPPKMHAYIEPHAKPEHYWQMGGSF